MELLQKRRAIHIQGNEMDQEDQTDSYLPLGNSSSINQQNLLHHMDITNQILKIQTLYKDACKNICHVIIGMLQYFIE